ncbi:MAG: methyltransferase domain-containing protein, partial [Thermoplasmata archaeon]|nr:methyltransferase domain-containing protein [Thermoplasmata archaeon]
MTPYEIMRVLCESILPAIYGKVRGDIKRMLQVTPEQLPQLLDVGGRKSPYTIGLNARITIMVIPREGEVRERLNLGLTDEILAQIKCKRSNIDRVLIEDMTQCTLPAEQFDGVVSIEVIEHVPQDHRFVEQIMRVLKPGGWLYVTTPNGDYCQNVPPNYNPDHIRHYTRQHLHDLLADFFDDVCVTYGIMTGKHRFRG